MGPGRAHQSVVKMFLAFWPPTAPSQGQEGGPRRRRGEGGPDAGDGTEVLTDPEPAVLRRLPPPHLAHCRKCVVDKALLRKLTSREDLSLQVRILAQKQEIVSSRPWEGRGIRYRPSEVRGNPGIPPPRHSEGPPVLLRARGPGPLPSWKILHVPLARFLFSFNPSSVKKNKYEIGLVPFSKG